MRLLVYLVIAVPFLFGQIVAASPRGDAEYIAQRIISENNHELVLQVITGAYVTYFTKELGKNSIKVTDPDRFAKMIPMGVVEPWIIRWQELFVDRLLEVYTPTQLDQIANSLDTWLGETGTSQTLNGKEIGRAMGVFTHFMTIQFIMQPEIKQSIPKLNKAPYLADILEIDGVFVFPNRIWRKNIIAKIRDGT